MQTVGLTTTVASRCDGCHALYRFPCGVLVGVKKKKKIEAFYFYILVISFMKKRDVLGDLKVITGWTKKTITNVVFRYCV